MCGKSRTLWVGCTSVYPKPDMCSESRTLWAGCTNVCPKPDMCSESRTLWQQDGRGAPTSTRNPAQAGGPREGSGPVRMPDSDDDVGFDMALPPSLGFYKRRRSPQCVSMLSGVSTQCVPASPLRPRLASTARLLFLISAHTTSTSSPAPSLLLLVSTLARWTPPFSTQAPPLEHDLHTCGCGQNNATIVGYRTTEHPPPPPKRPGTESYNLNLLPPWLQKSFFFIGVSSFSVCV